MDGDASDGASSLRVAVPEHVLTRELDGELVLLDLEGEQYFGLDEVGTRLWQRLADGDSLGEAHAALLEEYDVDAPTLEADLVTLVDELLAAGLLHRR